MRGIPWTHPVHLVAGLTVWACWFVVVCTGLSLGCQEIPPAEQRGPFNLVTGATLAGGILMAAGLFWAAWCCWRAGRRENVRTEPGRQKKRVAVTAAGLYLVSAVSALAIVLPGLVLTPCL